MPNTPVTVLLINVDGTTERRQLPNNGTATDLRQWQQAIGGGFLEPVYGEGWVALIDDDGLRKDLPLNLAATVALRRFGWPGEVVGPMLVAGRTDPDFADLPEETLELFEGVAERARTFHPSSGG